jgi:hypothetical protein
VPELDLGGQEPILVATDHALDALVAALVAGAHASGQTRPPNHDETAPATTEGWIWLPGRPIGELTETCDPAGGARAGRLPDLRRRRLLASRERAAPAGRLRRVVPRGGSSTRVLSDADMLEWYVT